MQEIERVLSGISAFHEISLAVAEKFPDMPYPAEKRQRILRLKDIFTNYTKTKKQTYQGG